MDNSRPSLRVLALLENNPYPTDCAVRPHMEALVNSGYRVTVICPLRKGQVTHEVIRGVEVYRTFIPTFGTSSLSYVIEFSWATMILTIMTLWIWLRQGMDILHVYNPPDTLFVCSILPRLAGKTIIYHLRDLGPELYLAKFNRPQKLIVKTLSLLEGISCRLANHIIVVNGSYQEKIMERQKIYPEQITIIRQGPDLDRIQLVDPILEVRFRAKTIIAFIGYMAKQDGIDHLLKSLYYLDRCFEYHEWLCLLIGSSETPHEIEAMAEELGIRDRIWLTGYLPYEKWVPLLCTADIGIEPAPANPLNNISTMNKLMDYMALGKPCVAYDLREHRVTAGDSALYASPNDEKDLARQILRLIENPALCQQLGQVGQERIRSSLAWSFQRERLLNLYASIYPSHPAQ